VATPSLPASGEGAGRPAHALKLRVWGLSLPSTSFLLPLSVDGRDKPGHDDVVKWFHMTGNPL